MRLFVCYRLEAMLVLLMAYWTLAASTAGAGGGQASTAGDGNTGARGEERYHRLVVQVDPGLGREGCQGLESLQVW